MKLEGATFKRSTNGEVVMVVNEDFHDGFIYYVIIKPKFIQKVFKETTREFHENYQRLCPPMADKHHKAGDKIIVMDDWTSHYFGDILTYTGSMSYENDGNLLLLFKNHEQQTIWLSPEMFIWS